MHGVVCIIPFLNTKQSLYNVTMGSIGLYNVTMVSIELYNVTMGSIGMDLVISDMCYKRDNFTKEL